MDEGERKEKGRGRGERGKRRRHGGEVGRKKGRKIGKEKEGEGGRVWIERREKGSEHC